jgi:hypothetical protein
MLAGFSSVAALSRLANERGEPITAGRNSAKIFSFAGVESHGGQMRPSGWNARNALLFCAKRGGSGNWRQGGKGEAVEAQCNQPIEQNAHGEGKLSAAQDCKKFDLFQLSRRKRKCGLEDGG